MTLRFRLLLVLLTAICIPAAALPVDGAGAKVAPSLGLHYERTGFLGLLSRADGSLLALRDRRIETYLEDGAPDPDAPATQLPAESSLFPAAGGKSYALGYRRLTRLDPDGTVDTGFGHRGTVEPPYGTGAVYELPSGKVALVSTEVNGTKTACGSVAVTLLNQDGSEDKGHGFGLSLGCSFAPAAGIGVPAISPTDDGGALVVGEDFLFEIGPDGSLERGFGKEGLVEVWGLIGGAVLPDGSVEGVGTATEERSGSGEDLALYRFTPGGQADTAFGPKGVRRFDLHAGQEEAKVTSWGADGSVIVGGSTRVHGPCPEEECEEAPILAAFDPGGELETGFGQGGWLVLKALAGPPQGGGSEGVTAIARRPDGSIVAAGEAPPSRTTGFLAAFSARGALLPGFGEGGIARVRDPLRASQEIVGLTPQPGGKLLAVGTADVGIEDHPILVRYDADGRLDRSLGAGAGYVVLGKGQLGGGHGATGFAVAGGKVLTGVYGYPLSHLVMARADDGSPVASFGADGVVALPRDIYALKVAFARGGDPVVLGRKRVAGPASAEPGVVLRYLPDGRLDRTFGKGGRFTMRLGKQPVRGKAFLTGPGGRMVLAGSVGRRFAIAGLLPDGRLDPSFGRRGWTVARFGAPTHHLAPARVGSRIYVAGTVGEERGEKDLVLMRLDRDGRLDRGFGRRGRITAPLSSWAQPSQILPTPAGVLVVLNRGPRPLVTFTPSGKIVRRSVGSRPRFVSDVRATVAGGRLVVGWTLYSPKNRAKVLHLVSRPLDRPRRYSRGSARTTVLPSGMSQL